MNILIALGIPFIGTTLGAAMVFFMKEKILTILLAAQMTKILPYFLSFAAGAMIYVVVEELIPEAQAGEHTNIGTIGTAIGFALMMVLDVALG